jgi:hypothetical protein
MPINVEVLSISAQTIDALVQAISGGPGSGSAGAAALFIIETWQQKYPAKPLVAH